MQDELALRSLILDAVNDAIFSTDTDLKISFWNRGAESLYGWTADEAMGRDWHELLQIEYSEGDRVKAMLELFDKGYWRGEVVHQRKDGTRINAISSRSVLKDQNGKPLGLVVTTHDITGRREAEDRLRQSEEKYRTLYDTMAQGVVYQDSGGRVVSANPAAQTILGLALDQILERSPLDPGCTAIHEDGGDFPGERHPPMIALRSGKVVKGVVMGVFNSQQEAYRWLDVSAVPQFRPGDKTPYQVFVTFTDITERKKAEETIRKLAFYDQVTGLPNRVLFNDRLGVAIRHARRSRKKVAVMMLDMDGFKGVNDTLGHEVGDLLLRSVGQRLNGLLRDSDTVGRMGGDEFLVLLPEVDQRSDAAVVADKIVAAFQTPFLINGRDLRVTASIGIAAYPGRVRNPDALVRHADVAMYQAKARGGNNWQWFAASQEAVES